MSRVKIASPVLRTDVRWPSTIAALPGSGTVEGRSPDHEVAELLGRSLKLEPSKALAQFMSDQQASAPTADELAASLQALEVTDSRYRKVVEGFTARLVASQLPRVDLDSRPMRAAQAELLREARVELAERIDTRIAELADVLPKATSLDLRSCGDLTASQHDAVMGLVVAMSWLAFTNPTQQSTIMATRYSNDSDALHRYLGIRPARGWNDLQDGLDRLDELKPTIPTPGNAHVSWDTADVLLRLLNGTTAEILGDAAAPFSAASLIDRGLLLEAHRVETLRADLRYSLDTNSKSKSREDANYHDRPWVSPLHIRALRNALAQPVPPDPRSL